MRIRLLALFLLSNLLFAQIVGGWYPIFFDTYSSEKVNQIVASIKAKKVKRILISYDENDCLASKIKKNISSKTNFPIEMDQVHQEDNTAQFNHMRVVVTVWSQ